MTNVKVNILNPLQLVPEVLFLVRELGVPLMKTLQNEGLAKTYIY